MSSGFTFLVIAYIFFNVNTLTIGEQIKFSTKNGEFTFTTIPSLGRDYRMMERELKEYRIINHISEELLLFRTTRINYFRINKWCQYKTMQEWKYPLLK